ncbi:MAG: alpha/beta hydrolase [Pyrinomonadaceae bacterium]
MKIGKIFLPAILLVLSKCLVAPGQSRVETIRLESKLANAVLPYNVILPIDYNLSKTHRYPVLYLLHGLNGHYSDWVSRTNIADYAAQYPIIVVTPEGNNSWYTDALNAPEKYESYILQELIPDVQRRYRTIEAVYGRSIAGLSMGGYGAIKLGLKSPSTFVFAGSMSGAFSVTRRTQERAGTDWNNELKIFGPIGSETRTANDLFEIIRPLSPERLSALPFFYLDVGTEDASWITNGNRELASLMFEKKIPHEFRELPGNHSWKYWDRQVIEVLKLAAERMRPPAVPARSQTVRKIRKP